MPEETEKKTCLVCDRTADETPLLRLDYRGSAFWICPAHLPILIHHPEQLAGRLPGALQAAEPCE